MKPRNPHINMFVVAIGPKKSVCELLRKTGKYIAEYECGSYDFKQVIKFDAQYLTKTWKTVSSCGFTADDTNKAILEIYGTDDPAFASIMESGIIPGSVEAWTVMDEKKFKLLLDFAKKGIHVVDVEGTHKVTKTLSFASWRPPLMAWQASPSMKRRMETVPIGTKRIWFTLIRDLWGLSGINNENEWAIFPSFTQKSCTPWNV